MKTEVKSYVFENPAASPQDAYQYFAGKLAYETDPVNVLEQSIKQAPLPQKQEGYSFTAYIQYP